MYRKWLALIGLFLIFAAVFIGLAGSQFWPGIVGPVPYAADPGIWDSVQSMTGISRRQAFTLSVIGLLLGIMLTIPWWRQRLRHEEIWWHRSDGPVKGPPKAGV